MDHRHVMHCKPLLIVLLAAAWSAPAVAQDGDRIAKPITVRVVGHGDGLPRPGVPLHAGLASPPATADADGWVLAESADVRRLRAATIVFTDPEGRATLGSSPHPLALQVGEPYFRWGNPKVDGSEWLVEVGQREPVGVRVVDQDGKPLADFPVALHAAGKDLSVALTDATGRALLGVPADFKARAVIAPAGWVGPKQGFPSIAESLAGRRGAVLTVPPHGSLRIRVVRNGEPVREAVNATGFFAPETYAPLSDAPDAFVDSAIGVIYPRVALDLELECYLPIQRAGAGLLRCRGPRAAGACETVDIDLGPRISFRIAGVESAPRLVPPEVLLVCDEGALRVHADPRDDGTFVVDARAVLPGKRLRRIDVDVAAGQPGHRSGTLAVDRALPAAQLQLGEVQLAAVERPQLRGVVLDERGQPMAEVQVAISATGKRNEGYVVRSDAEGRFVSRQPILRGDDGAPTELFAYAYTGQLEAPAAQAVAGQVTLTLRARASRHPAIKQQGVVVARLEGLADTRDLRMRLRLVSRHGEFAPTEVVVRDDGKVLARFERLREGTFALRVPGPDGAPVAVLEGLEVSGDGECADARLTGIDCGKALQEVAVEVVDAAGVPIAGARLEGQGFARETDGRGTARLWIGRGTSPSVLVWAPGSRGRRVEEWPAQQRVQLERAGTLQVEVVGLPADFAREHFEVWLRDEVRERFAGPRRMLAAGSDTVTLDLPARGRYLPMLLMTRRNADGNGSSSATVHAATAPVEIGDAVDAPIRLVVSDEELARLRTWLAK